MKKRALGFIRSVIAAVACASASSLLADDVVYDATYYVNAETGLDTNDGSQAAPFQSLSKAWSKSAAGSSVHVIMAKGTYPVKETLTMDHSGVFHVEGATQNPKDVVIQQVRQANDNTVRTFNIGLTSTGFLLRFVTVKGHPSAARLALFKAGRIANCIITETHGDAGGVLFLTGNGILENCLFVNNSVAGAMQVDCQSDGNGNSCHPKIINCTFVNPSGKKGVNSGWTNLELYNTVEYGGGTVGYVAGMTIKNCAGDFASGSENFVQLTEDPFQNSAKGDYRPREGSVLVGVADAEVYAEKAISALDLYGSTRFAEEVRFENDTKLEIGAYQVGTGEEGGEGEGEDEDPSDYDATYYVSPNGSDLNTGTTLFPFKTLAKAFSKSSTAQKTLVLIEDGSYSIEQTISVTDDRTIHLEGLSKDPTKVTISASRMFLVSSAAVNFQLRYVTLTGGDNHIMLLEAGRLANSIVTGCLPGGSNRPDTLYLSGSGIIENCLFYNNRSAKENGKASQVYCAKDTGVTGGNPKVINCTFINGESQVGVNAKWTNLEMYNCVEYGSGISGHAPGIVFKNCAGDYDNPGEDNGFVKLDSDPFKNSTGADFRPAATDSPLAGAADVASYQANATSELDLRGKSRFAENGSLDIGAYQAFVEGEGGGEEGDDPDHEIVYYVDPVSGDDSADGSEGAPFKSLKTAVQNAPLLKKSVIFLADGVYAVGETIKLDSTNPKQVQIVGRSKDPRKVVLKGLRMFQVTGVCPEFQLRYVTLTGNGNKPENGNRHIALFEGGRVANCIISGYVKMDATDKLDTVFLSGDAILENCLFYGNQGDYQVWCKQDNGVASDARPKIVNCTFVNAPNQIGIYSEWGNLEVYNCAEYGSGMTDRRSGTFANCAGDFDSDSANFVKLTADPFRDSPRDDYRPSATSALVGGATSSNDYAAVAISETDLRGKSRFKAGVIDIGAYQAFAEGDDDGSEPEYDETYCFAPDGNDANEGTFERPKRDLKGWLKNSYTEGRRVHLLLKDGTYMLDKRDFAVGKIHLEGLSKNPANVVLDLGTVSRAFTVGGLGELVIEYATLKKGAQRFAAFGKGRISNCIFDGTNSEASDALFKRGVILVNGPATVENCLFCTNSSSPQVVVCDDCNMLSNHHARVINCTFANAEGQCGIGTAWAGVEAYNCVEFGGGQDGRDTEPCVAWMKNCAGDFNAPGRAVKFVKLTADPFANAAEGDYRPSKDPRSPLIGKGDKKAYADYATVQRDVTGGEPGSGLDIGAYQTGLSYGFLLYIR